MASEIRAAPADHGGAEGRWLPVTLEILEDPFVWIGAALGVGGMLTVMTMLWCVGCLYCRLPFGRRRMYRLNSSNSIDGETWYDAIEDGLGGLADYPRFAAHYASEAIVPLLATEAGVEPSSKPRRARLSRLTGKSLPRLAPEERENQVLPEGEFHPPSWSEANAGDLCVRQGPNYPKTGNKEPSLPALYTAVGVDTVRGGTRIDDPIPRLGPLPPSERWHRETLVPRCVIVNCQIPFQEGPKLYGQHPAEDAGASIVAQFTATPELLRVASAEARGTYNGDAAKEPILPAVRLLQRLFKKGSFEQEKGEKVGFHSSCTVKAIGWVENIGEVPLPAMLRPTIERFNGKPVLLSIAGHMQVDPNGEWMSFDFDVRTFRWFSRSMLCRLRGLFRTVSVHCAFVIQGTLDEELPEVVLGSVRIHAMDLDGSAWIEDPRAPPDSLPPEEQQQSEGS